MAFVYEVLTKEQAESERFQLLTPGNYEAVVTRAQDRQSSTGNAMMDITLSVFDNNGISHDIRDFLVFTKPMMWKIVHFAESAGLYDIYEQGKLCSEAALNKHVNVKVGVEEGREIPLDKLNNKPAGARYPSKNKVVNYFLREKTVTTMTGNLATALKDDDLPF